MPNKKPGRPKRVNGCAKGKVGERELAGVLRDAGWTDARRGQQRSGLDQNDVIGVPGWRIEAKRVERLNMFKAFAQAQRDAGGDEEPMVAARRNGGAWLAVVRLDTMLGILAALRSLTEDRGSGEGGGDR